MRQRSWWGWGWADEALSDAQCRALAERVAGLLPLDGDLTPVPAVPDLVAPRVRLPTSLAHLGSTDPHDRARHTYGQAYRDVVRRLRGDLAGAPDVVARPRDGDDVAALLDWARDCFVVPYGGGTSVVGGVECRDRSRPVVCLDLSGVDGVVEVDEVSRVARVRGGTFGPAIEDALRPYGLTLRHFPQSFEFSTLGGWIATRAGGHFATGPTHIDDLVEAVDLITPVGRATSPRVPASGAGPSADRLWLGSEGVLGIVTEAWVRVRPRPRFTAGATVAFADVSAAVDATRAIVQSGLAPANCRLLDPVEAMIGAGATDGAARLLLAFESADAPVDAERDRAVTLARDHGGQPSTEDGRGGGPDGAAAGGGTRGGDGARAAWRDTFLRAPYLRDALARLGVVVETVETACTWSAYPALRAALTAALDGTGAVLAERFTHVYPDGPAPYYTVYAPGRRGAEVEQWDEVKARLSAAITDHGGTITHHHAVGRDHRPWYDRERPDPFARALTAARRALDPYGQLNPGVLTDG